MSRELFNFIWVPGRKGNTIHIGASTDRLEASVHKPKQAVILYPTLFTPAVYVQGRATPVVELLIAAKEELFAADVNVHLKISPGLDPEKAYDARPLFVNPEGLIVLEKTKKNGDGILHTFRRFSGILSEQAEKLYEPYSHIYKVSVSDSAVRRERPELMEKLSSRMTVGDLPNAIVGQEPQDVSIANFLENAGERGGDAGKVPGRRRYGFKIVGDKIDLAQANPDEPIQSYHPLFVWSADLAVANFGHVSDVHVNARLNILRRSPACVVEDPVTPSPEVGTRLVDTNDSFASVLGQMRQDPTVHALAIGGDLIDHIRNTYNRDLFDAGHAATIDAIWSAVDLGAGGLHERYPAGIDYMLFYSMVVDFCRRSSKPIFGISGNHDAYEEPFGISPRVGFARANAGIPADLNLTFYEALLAFGPTWPTVVKKGNFNKDWWVWFYQVFGAFNDFVVRLPAQGVVGLGWGSQEDMLADEQGLAHLPRSDDAVTDGQLALLRLQMPVHVVLFTHFTVLSFDDPIAMTDAAGRKMTGTLSEDLNSFNMGTFETNREAMIDLFSTPALQLIISGHSHRRGTYQITGSPEKGTLAITMHDTKRIGGAVSAFRAPVIAISDSAGPMPRLNIAGEFAEWGSDVAGGTLATFASDASLMSIGGVGADRPRPRVCVAFDYLDITRDSSEVFLSDPITDWVSVADEAAAVAGSIPATLYTLALPFNVALLARTKIAIGSVTLHGAVEKTGGGLQWLRIELQRADTGGLRWSVPGAQSKDFHTWATACLETFLALTFQSSDSFLSSHYNWADPWQFEVLRSRFTNRSKQVRYSFARPSRDASGSSVFDWHFKEIPDFEWRRKNLSKYAAKS